MDITPLIPNTKQLITGYGGGRFMINGEPHAYSVLVLPERFIEWPVADAKDITLASLEPALEAGVELLLIGTGARMELLVELRKEAKARGVTVEVMDTGAACRTYNVLMAEGRNVAAALMVV